MPGGWLIGLGAGLQGAGQATELYARMREANERTELQRQQQAQQAQYQQQQVDIAKRAADVNQAQWTVENAPWEGIVPPSVQDLLKRTQMEHHMRVDPAVGASLPGTGLNLPTGLPGGRGPGGGELLTRPANPAHAWTMTPSAGAETPFPTGMAQGPTIGTPSTPVEETGGRTTFVPTETSKLRTQLAGYEARRATAEEANKARLLDIQNRMTLGTGRLDETIRNNNMDNAIAMLAHGIASGNAADRAQQLEFRVAQLHILSNQTADLEVAREYAERKDKIGAQFDPAEDPSIRAARVRARASQIFQEALVAAQEQARGGGKPIPQPTGPPPGSYPAGRGVRGGPGPEPAPTQPAPPGGLPAPPTQRPGGPAQDVMPPSGHAAPPPTGGLGSNPVSEPSEFGYGRHPDPRGESSEQNRREQIAIAYLKGHKDPKTGLPDPLRTWPEDVAWVIANKPELFR